MRILLLCITVISFGLKAGAQESSDTTRHLQEVEVQAYYNRGLAIAAGFSQVNSEALKQQNPISWVQSFQRVAGAELEERSAGSYRLNIRGSSLRAPYGVRNVKIYFDGIPFTAPNGNSMLNMLDLSQIAGFDLIKGPGSSLYGSGMGGVLFLKAYPQYEHAQVHVSQQLSTAGLWHRQLQLNLPQHQLQYAGLNDGGYRAHSRMHREALSYTANLWHTNTHFMRLHALYSHLNYQTPGALTEKEYMQDARAARPAAGAFPSAETANAHLRQDNLWLGLREEWAFSPAWRWSNAFYIMWSKTLNPTVQNYEQKQEPHQGVRSVLHYSRAWAKLLVEPALGVEYQRGDFQYRLFDNHAGEAGKFRYRDDLFNAQYLAFMQIKLSYKPWQLSVGNSINGARLNFRHHAIDATTVEQLKQKGEWAPRFSLLYQIHPNWHSFLQFSKGFSAPSANEIFADQSAYNLLLQPESAWSWEYGWRAKFLQRALSMEASVYYTNMHNALVTRKDAGGGNYFLNAGSSRQWGLEWNAIYQSPSSVFIWPAELGLNISLHQAKYKNFYSNGQDFSGNRMPGTAAFTLKVFAAWQWQQKYFFNLQYRAWNSMFLNDANSQRTAPAHMVNANFNWQALQNMGFSIGLDNALNDTYSLGNDINAFGGRYYNLAAGRTLYFGLKYMLKKN